MCGNLCHWWRFVHIEYLILLSCWGLRADLKQTCGPLTASMNCETQTVINASERPNLKPLLGCVSVPFQVLSRCSMQRLGRSNLKPDTVLISSRASECTLAIVPVPIVDTRWVFEERHKNCSMNRFRPF